jgi:peptide subunit release factor 1 (eRF1)
MAPPAVLPDELISSIAGSDTGAVVFWDAPQPYVVLPPFPVETSASFDGWRLDVLTDLVDRPRRIGVLLLRLGSFAVGIYESRTLVSSKVGSRFVKGRHSKGGSSQARFQRRRDEQARALYRKACEVLQDVVDAYPARLDHFLAGGDRRTLAAFEKDCSYLERLERLRLGRVLDVRHPNLAALKSLPPAIYECVVIGGDDT